MEKLHLRSSECELLHCRSIELKPDSWDENTRSVRAVFATDKPAVSMDARTGKGVLEVWRMDGAEYGDRAPLCDSHNRSSCRAVLGSIIPEGVETDADGSQRLVGRLQISEAEPGIATKVREGHLRAVSGGIQPLEGESIPKNQTRSVRGVPYTAPSDRDLHVVTKWRLREVSLVPIGADPDAMIRSESFTMNEKTRSFLEGIGLAKEATPAEAQAFYDGLPEATRKLADAGKLQAVTSPAEPVNVEKVRKEAEVAERNRVKELTRMGEGLPEETVRKAVDDGWTVERAAPVFLDAIRDRKPAATPAIHTKADCTPAEIGMGLALRSVDGEKLLKQQASYVETGDGNYLLRKTYDADGHRKAMEKLLTEGDRYRALSLHDVCREACRLDGKPVSIHAGPAETFRTAVSGSALTQIFTTNVNAQFQTGYMDAVDTTNGWCSEAEVNNFLTNERDTMGKFGSLQKAVKGRPAEHLDTSDWKESYKISRYTGQFVVDEQDIINDRFGAMESEAPKDMGMTAAQLRQNLVYALILANAALDVDGVALFHATHSNLTSGGSSALSADSLQSAIAAMAKQRIRNRVLNVQPRYLIVPQDLRWTAEILLQSAQRIISSASGGTYNPLLGAGLQVVMDDRLGAAGVTDPNTGTAYTGTATNWLLAARPGEQGAKTIEVGYLRGTGRAPSIRSFVLDKGQWGIGWDIKMDIGVKALDYRAMYKSAGA